MDRKLDAITEPEAASPAAFTACTVGDPGFGRSYWQPEPANGYVTVLVNPAETGSDTAAMGVQAVAPAGRVREHAHVDQEEVIFVLAGQGTAMIDDIPRAMTPGATFFLGKGVRHSFINDGSNELVFTWTIIPGRGLHEFFAAIGRPRLAGESAPEAFPRPADVSAIESRTGFAAKGSRDTAAHAPRS